MADKKIIQLQSITAMGCHWSVGKYVDRFLAGLAAGKIEGIKCGKCGKVYVPPQKVCADCFIENSEWVELSGRGEVVNYTVAHVDVRNEKLDEPKVIGMIRLEGADTTVFGVVKGPTPGPGLVGKKVKAVFRAERKGSIRDISHYEAV